jgi:hypothetical protein
MTKIPISSAPIYKTMITDGHSIFPVSTIEYRGHFWLVPEWIVNDTEGWRMPARVIGLGPLQVQDLRGKNGFPADFSVPSAIPRPVLDDLFQGKKVAGWPCATEEKPPIRFPLQPSIH